jgi:hypothetical protein
LSAERHHLIRAFGLLWGRLGSARFYIAAIAIGVVTLAAIEIWHLVLPVKQVAPSPTIPISEATPPPASTRQTAAARISPSAELSSPAPSVAPELERHVAITDVTAKEQRGARGETFVVATIGLASRTNVERSGVEIHVYFYDLTAANEMRPTDAQVTYQWLTPIRDWSDPTPKYLAATYFKPPTRYRSSDRLRYGGFIVRVLSDGKLQDERSKPEGLIAQLRSNASEQQTPAPSSPTVSASRPVPPSSFSPPPSTSSVRSPTSDLRPQTSDSTLPYGKPIPGKPGFLYSPYDEKFIIDVRGFPPGTLVNDPNTNKPFRVP